MKRVALVFALTLFVVSASLSAETVRLPAPQKTGGPELFTAIDSRASARHVDFPAGELSRQDAATLLWAATGHNRDGKKWTVPMAMGAAPYCTVYYADKDGAYRYDWKAHALVKVADGNILPATMAQDFSKKAPAAMFIIEDGAEKANIRAFSEEIKDEFTALLAGMMAQNVYLASQGVKVGARLVYSMDRQEAGKLLNLPDVDKPFFAIVLGKE